jgi:hypothetical protein
MVWRQVFRPIRLARLQRGSAAGLGRHGAELDIVINDPPSLGPIVAQKAFLLAATGFAVTLLLAIAALALSGGGDGWNAPIQVSLLAVAVVPTLGISWTYRHSELGRTLAILVVLAAIGLDLFGVVQTRGELAFFRRALHESRQLTVVWCSLWLLWQAAAVAHLLQFRSHEVD